MKMPCQCSGRRSPGARRRWLVGLTRWAMPSIVLAIMPKCPVCFAGYVAMASGIGLTIPQAAALRVGLVILCLTSLGYLAIKQLRRISAARTAVH